jgi:hypothetical protein
MRSRKPPETDADRAARHRLIERQIEDHLAAARRLPKEVQDLPAWLRGGE